MPSAGAEDIELGRFRGRARGRPAGAVSSSAPPATSSPVKDRIRDAGADIPLIAKIEKPQAAEAIDEIVAAAGGGIMVARGDLGIELPIESVPVVQKRIRRRARPRSRRSPRPRCWPRWCARPPDASGGDRRRQCDLRRHRRRDALARRRRSAITRSRPSKVMDRIARADRGRPALRALAAGAGRHRQRHRRLGRPGRGRLDLPARAQGDRRPDPLGAHRAIGLGLRPRVPVLALSPRIETVRRLNLLFGVELRLPR